MPMLQKIVALVKQHHQIIKYIISGGTAAVVNIGSMYVFTDFLHIWYLISGVISFIFGFLVSFLLQKYWTFADKSTDTVHKQAALYFIVALINLAWNTLLLYIFVDLFHLWYIIAAILAGAIVALTSYLQEIYI
jgi:dolichol-phosphate mannosyltransferase